MEFQPFCLTEIQFISKQCLEQQLLTIREKNIVMVLSEASADRYHLHGTLSSMFLLNHIIWINAVKANPTQAEILEALHMIGNNPVDLLIAIGGGSAIDLAKAISAFYGNMDTTPTIDSITKKLEQKTYYLHEHFIDIIAVPTTAGTGSELTQWATIWDINRKKKYSIDHVKLQPKKAFIVPELTLTLSKEMTLSTGLDALSHAVEAYWSKHTGPVIQELAYRAIQIITEYLQQVLDTPDAYSLRETMCRASVLAGMAFSKTRTTACHSISYPLTMLYDIPHGIAAAMTLGEVGLKNSGCFSNDKALYDLFNKYGGIQKWIDQVCQGIINPRLSAFSIEKKDIGVIVDHAFTSGRMDNNPVELNKSDVYAILEHIY